jgi:chromosomal replication initiator protein
MQETYNGIWREIAKGIRLQISADAFQRWFAAIELVQSDEIALTFEVPNSIYQFWIESNYLNVVQGAAISVLGSPREVKYRAADSGMSGPLVDAHADRGSEALAPLSHDEDSESAINHGMNPRNRFEAFVVGSNNQFAYAAALAVSQSPARTYNPLFIYGGVGLGKTHLMQAIGQQTIERRRSKR